MQTPAKLPGKPPRQFVEILIGVNEVHCKAPKDVKKLDGTWMRVQVATIIGFVAAHFEDAPIHPAEKATEKEARLRQAWSFLCDFNPRSAHDGKRKRLIVTPGNNSDFRSWMSQLLGVGLGLAVICKRLGISLASVHKLNFSSKTRHDFDAERNGLPVRLEVRGRFKKAGRTQAITQVKKKFKTQHDFAQVVAAQVYPFDSAKRDAVDVELLDPGQGPPLPLEQRLKRVIGHYAGYLAHQNVDGYHLLRMLTEIPDEDFLRFFRSTWRRLWRSQLQDTALSGVTTTGRTKLLLGDDLYFGTYWEGAAAPDWVRSIHPEVGLGFAFMGVWNGVFEAFLDENSTLALLQLDVEGSSYSSEGVAYMRLSDGFLVAWSSDLDVLLGHS